MLLSVYWKINNLHIIGSEFLNKTVGNTCERIFNIEKCKDGFLILSCLYF